MKLTTFISTSIIFLSYSHCFYKSFHAPEGISALIIAAQVEEQVIWKNKSEQKYGKEIVCIFCKKSYQSGTLKEHYCTQHQDRVTNYVELFGFKDTQRNLGVFSEKLWKCTICGHIFFLESHLTRHLSRKHQ